MNKPPAIVLLTTSFPVLGDGSEAAGSFVSDFAEELARHITVRVVAPGTSSTRETSSDGVEVYRYQAQDKPLSTLKPWLPADALAIYRVLVNGELATRAAIQAGPTLHLVALWALPSGHWARRIATEFNVPYSVWTLGSDIWTLGRLPLVRGYLRTVLRSARTCYADGLKLADDTKQLGDRPVTFLPSTRKISRHRDAALKESPPYSLLFLGRWHVNKGVDLLLSALAGLDDEHWQRIESVRICGGGPLEGLVRCATKNLRDQGRPVEMFGYLDKAAAEEALLKADYLLIPSRVESIPLVFSDAMKLGCAVVATPVGDFPALFAKDAFGVLSTGCDIVAIQSAISMALHSPVTKFAAALANHAKAFDLSEVAARLLAGIGCQSELDENA